VGVLVVVSPFQRPQVAAGELEAAIETAAGIARAALEAVP